MSGFDLFKKVDVNSLTCTLFFMAPESLAGNPDDGSVDRHAIGTCVQVAVTGFISGPA
jgi:hypothetical protein